MLIDWVFTKGSKEDKKNFFKIMKEAVKKTNETSNEDFFKEVYNEYKSMSENKTNFSNWFFAISEAIGKNELIKIPYSQVIKIPFEVWKWIRLDLHKKEEVINFSIGIIGQIKEELKGKKLFLKSGVFSNKFEFGNCVIEPNELNTIGIKFLNICHYCQLVNCPLSNEIVIREFIETKSDRKSIYEGMKLNTEIRLFYDFDNSKVIGTVNYWDKVYVGNNLHNPVDEEVFKQESDKIENEYNEIKDILVVEVDRVLKDSKALKGKYSIDFMYDGEKFWLIDMAEAEKSAYWERFGERKKLNG